MSAGRSTLDPQLAIVRVIGNSTGWRMSSVVHACCGTTTSEAQVITGCVMVEQVRSIDFRSTPALFS